MPSIISDTTATGPMARAALPIQGYYQWRGGRSCCLSVCHSKQKEREKRRFISVQVRTRTTQTSVSAAHQIKRERTENRNHRQFLPSSFTCLGPVGCSCEIVNYSSPSVHVGDAPGQLLLPLHCPNRWPSWK
jgi:hypothetical protein